MQEYFERLQIDSEFKLKKCKNLINLKFTDFLSINDLFYRRKYCKRMRKLWGNVSIRLEKTLGLQVN
jgi:hypothetical protein